MSDSTAWDFPNSATSDASANYYVVRFSSTKIQNTLAYWLAWFQQIDSIADKAIDPGVARLKLDWWHQEIDNCLTQQARHPIAIALQSTIKSSGQIEQMHRALHAVEQRILKRSPINQDEFWEQTRNDFGSRLILLCDTNNLEQRQILNKLGSYIAAVSRFQKLGRDIPKDYLSLPKNLLEQHQITTAQVESYDDLPQLAGLAFELLDPLQQEITQQQACYRKQPELAPALRFFAQSVQLVKLMRKKQFSCNQRQFNLSPIRLLWSAWRMRW